MNKQLHSTVLLRTVQQVMKELFEGQDVVLELRPGIRCRLTVRTQNLAPQPNLYLSSRMQTSQCNTLLLSFISCSRRKSRDQCIEQEQRENDSNRDRRRPWS